ncbi:MAG TPA: AEC family transporter [Terrimicrobiaceae bacterium]|nr:AEC family transporter [Terrimicrobiaceae bacterium]
MPVLETLAPLILLIVLGSALAHIRFLGREFMADLNKLAFWIALPALLFTSANHAAEPGSQTWRLLAVLIAGTLLITLAAWLLSFPLGLPGTARGTLAQSAFRGNQAYIGIPVLAYSLGDDKKAMATTVIVMVLLMATYNVLAVVVLQSSRHTGQKIDWGRLLRSIATNPLLLAGLLGLMFPLLHLTPPAFVDRALQSLGNAAVPIALLCIGGSLAITPLRGRRSWIVAAALLKIAVLPLLVFWLARLAGLNPPETLIALVLASCPTAAASFIMAKQMGGDEALASGSIALSTVLSAASLGVILWIT